MKKNHNNRTLLYVIDWYVHLTKETIQCQVPSLESWDPYNGRRTNKETFTRINVTTRNTENFISIAFLKYIL